MEVDPHDPEDQLTARGRDGAMMETSWKLEAMMEA